VIDLQIISGGKTMTIDELKKEIKAKRKIMYDKYNETEGSLCSKEVVKISQELDKDLTKLFKLQGK
jgi:hypothetical protein